MGEKALAEMKENLKAVQQTEPGKLSIVQLAKYESGFAATIAHVEEVQARVKRMIEAKTEEEFEVVIHEMAALAHQNPRPTYEAFIGELK